MPKKQKPGLKFSFVEALIMLFIIGIVFIVGFIIALNRWTN